MSGWTLVYDDDAYIEGWWDGQQTIELDRADFGLPPLYEIPAKDIETTPMAGPPEVSSTDA